MAGAFAYAGGWLSPERLTPARMIGAFEEANGVHPGFVVGGGFEYYVARHYSLTTEYGFNHVNSFNLSNADFDVEGASERLHYNTLTVGFNYHF